MKAPRITVEWLRQKKACASCVQKFERLWPNGAPVTLATWRKAEKTLCQCDIKWLEEQLSPKVKEEYEDALEQAHEQYKKDTSTAKKKYEKARAPHRKRHNDATAAMWEKFQTIKAGLWDKYGADADAPMKVRIAHGEAFGEYWEAARPAREKCDKAIAPAKAEFAKVDKPASAAYYKACAKAFVAAVRAELRKSDV